MSDLKDRAIKAARVLRAHRGQDPLDEAALVEKWDREHGMHLSRRERSKRRYDLGNGAPRIGYTPPQLRK